MMNVNLDKLFNHKQDIFIPNRPFSKEVDPAHSYFSLNQGTNQTTTHKISRTMKLSLDIMRQTSWQVINPIIVDGYALLFNCTTAVRASDSMMASS